MATNQDLVDTFEAILTSVTNQFTTPYLEERVIDKAQLVQILMGTIAPALDEAVKFIESKCREAQCQYELKNILPLQATKLQLENRLIKCQIDKCCYELENILPLEKERLELEKEKLAMERDRLEAEKNKMICETAKCNYEVNTYLPAQVSLIDTQRSEMSSMGTSNRDLNVKKGLLFDQQKEGIVDKKQLGMMSQLADLYTIHVTEEPDEDIRLNIMNRDSDKNQISAFENALHTLATDVEEITLRKQVDVVDTPIVTVSNYDNASDQFTATFNTHPEYFLFVNDQTIGIEVKLTPDANGDASTAFTGSGGESLKGTWYTVYATNPQGVQSTVVQGIIR